MPHLNGVAAAGNAEATRVAQTVIHRGAEAAAVAVEGRREDRAHAERMPEVGAGARIDRREREQERRRRRRGRDHDEDAPPDDPVSGSLIDVQA